MLKNKKYYERDNDSVKGKKAYRERLNEEVDAKKQIELFVTQWVDGDYDYEDMTGDNYKNEQ